MVVSEAIHGATESHPPIMNIQTFAKKQLGVYLSGNIERLGNVKK